MNHYDRASRGLRQALPDTSAVGILNLEPIILNHLAHIYLSGNDDFLKIGNFIADSVKGKAYMDYPKGIQKGILLHRKIDAFTDTHPIVRKSIKRLSPKFGLYSGAITDMLYDHLLAANWENYCSISLEKYSEGFYSLTRANYKLLPKRVQHFFPYMEKDNWLLSYSTIPGIEKALFQMNRRVKTGVKLNLAIEDFRENHALFKKEFETFFEELRGYVETKLP